tara:strand:+ start:109 stop:261 length:153 start_codon:yes stop_codon:yes gene_type:complete
MPLTSHDTPHKYLRKCRTAVTQSEATFCKDMVLTNGYKKMIINDAKITLI